MTRVRRSFVDGPSGQIHVRIAAGPAEAPPLVCLHHSPSSGRIFAPVLPRLARRRTVLAPDLPGYGESDRPRERPSIRDYARELSTALGPLLGTRYDLLGYHTGASVAAEWVALRPGEVRRLILVGAPLFTPEVRQTMVGTRWPAPPSEDGAGLLREWRMVLDNHRLPLSLQSKAAIFHEMYRAGDAAWWGGAAVADHDLEAALARIDVPTLVLETADYLKGSGPRVSALVRGSVWKDWQHLGHGLFEAAVEEVGAEVDAFLDAP